MTIERHLYNWLRQLKKKLGSITKRCKITVVKINGFLPKDQAEGRACNSCQHFSYCICRCNTYSINQFNFAVADDIETFTCGINGNALKKCTGSKDSSLESLKWKSEIKKW